MSRIVAAFVGPLPALALGVGLLIYLDAHSWLMQLLVIAPIAFAGSFLMGFLLARFGQFRAIDPADKTL